MNRPRTPYLVNCAGDPPEVHGCGPVFLTEAEYDRQMNAPDVTWRCPQCRQEATWDDANYDSFYSQELE